MVNDGISVLERPRVLHNCIGSSGP